MSEIYCMNNEKAKTFLSVKIEKAKKDAEKFYKEHEDAIKFFTPIVASVAIAGLKFASSNKTRKSERFHETAIYDRREGHYWQLKRKPTNRQWTEIGMRHERGESYRKILTDMNLLKR